MHVATMGVLAAQPKMCPCTLRCAAKAGECLVLWENAHCTIPTLPEEQRITPVKSAWESVAQKGTSSCPRQPCFTSVVRIGF